MVPPVRGSEMWGVWPIGDSPAQKIGDELVKIDSALHHLQNEGGSIEEHKDTVETSLHKIHTLISDLPHAKKNGARHLLDSLKAECADIFNRDNVRRSTKVELPTILHTLEDFHGYLGY